MSDRDPLLDSGPMPGAGDRDALLGAMKQHLRQLDAAVRATAATVQAIEIANATKAANAAHLSDSVEQLRRSVETVSEAAAGLRTEVEGLKIRLTMIGTGAGAGGGLLAALASALIGGG